MKSALAAIQELNEAKEREQTQGFKSYALTDTRVQKAAAKNRRDREDMAQALRDMPNKRSDDKGSQETLRHDGLASREKGRRNRRAEKMETKVCWLQKERAHHKRMPMQEPTWRQKERKRKQGK